jgi:hypothetical protein
MKEEWYGAIYRRYLRKLSEFQRDRPNRYNMLMSSFFVFCAYVFLFPCGHVLTVSRSQAARNDVPPDAEIQSDDGGWVLFDEDSDDDAPL